ncbi:MAG TPA: DUF2911 domain-containing protein [Bryobacteraceae bacterium]|jgi:hypothetical protein|nr:DUF2911 domain-containing protein [Bryobacteraceae bacterium]
MTRRAALLFFPLAIPVFSFQEKRKSPHETVSAELNGKKIEITYGRPYLKGRKMSSVTPDGQVWRLGADEATKLTVGLPVIIGKELKLAPGSYSLFAITGPDKWTMIVNKTADQWGAFSYQESQDTGRFDLPVHKTASPVEEFTITLGTARGSEVPLTLAWGDQQVETIIKAS